MIFLCKENDSMDKSMTKSQLFNPTKWYDKYHVNKRTDYHHISFKYHKWQDTLDEYEALFMIDQLIQWIRSNLFSILATRRSFKIAKGVGHKKKSSKYERNDYFVMTRSISKCKNTTSLTQSICAHVIIMLRYAIIGKFIRTSSGRTHDNYKWNIDDRVVRNVLKNIISQIGQTHFGPSP